MLGWMLEWMLEWMEEWWGDFVLRTTSVSPLDRDKDTLSLTRKNAGAFFRFILTGRIGESEDDGVFEQAEFYFD